MKESNRHIIIRAFIQSIIFGAALWIIDSIVDWLFFYDGTFVELILSKVPSHEIYIRTVFIIAIFVFGLINAGNRLRLKNSNKKLRNTNKELDAINQQLSANEQQLKANNQQLIASEQELARKAHDLKERNKELNGLYTIYNSIWKNNDINIILQDAVDVIPSSWHYPEITKGRISYKEKVFLSKDFKESDWYQSAPIIVDNQDVGKIEVFYTEKKPDLDEGPFMKEERKLINTIAGNLGRAIVNIQDHNQLKVHEKQYRAIFNGIDDLIYISDPNTYELVHANDSLKDSWGANITSKKCYEVLQNRNSPCAFCTNDKIMGDNFGKTHIWEFQNEITKKWYRCADKGIQWPDGRKLRFEIATDISGSVKLNEELLASNQQLAANEEQLKALNIEFKNNEKIQEDLKLQLQLANDSAGIGVWVFDLIQNVLIWDDWMYKLYGIDPEDFEGAFEAWQNGLHPDDLEKASKEVDLAISGEKEFDTEFRIISPSGKIRYLKANATVIKDHNDKAIKMIGVNYDITRIKDIEKELKANENRYLQTEKIASVGSWEYDVKTTQFWGSEEARRIYGFALNDNNFTTEYVENCIPDRVRVHQALVDLIERNKAYDLTFDIITFDQKIRKTVRSIAILEKDSKDKPIKVIGAIQDISKQKQIESQLLEAKNIAQENETRFKALHNASFGGITIHDKGLILDCNQGLAEITGYSHEELIGMDGLLLIAEETRDLVKSHILSKYEKPYEAVGIRKNGEKYPVRLEARMIPYKGKEVRVVEFRDITEQKNVEHQLIKARKKAEESDQLKSAFLANMSHEIRTPMNGILGFTSLLEEPDLTGEEQAQYIEIIKRNGLKMLDTVNDIIDISKIDAGQMELIKTKFDFCFELNSIYQFFLPEAQKKGLKMTYHKKNIADELQIETDKNKLNSILTNLIKNAIKYTDKGSIEIHIIKENNHIICQIKDTGLGIPKEKQKSVFNRFEQVNIYNNKAIEGSGLGLAISKSYAEMMKGQLEVESEYGRGSTFSFSFPI